MKDRFTIFTTFWLSKHFKWNIARCSEIHIHVGEVIFSTTLQCEIFLIIYEWFRCLEYFLYQQIKKNNNKNNCSQFQCIVTIHIT